MSATAYSIPSARWGARMFDAKMTDMMVNDGLWDAFNNYHMGMTAENVAEQWGITREELDEFSVISQQRAEKAVDGGVFDEEIVPVMVPQRKKDPIEFNRDEHLTRGSTMEKVAKLKPAFKKDGGGVTAANASGINDSGAAVVVMSKEKADELGIEPMATIVSYASAGVDPSIMGVGPVPSSKKALEKAGLTIEDIDLVEANEAFRSTVTGSQKGSGTGSREDKRQRRRDRSGSPDRSIRLQNPRNPAVRDEEKRRQEGSRYTVHRRRHGYSADRRKIRQT